MTSLLEASGLAIPGRLQPTSLTAESGSLIAIIGVNGSGKTSLLRALARIDADAGEVRIDGEVLADTPPARRRQLLGFLPASREVIWPIRARSVMALGLDRDDPRRIAELAELLQLAPLLDRPISELSTGERARVLLARVLAARPRLLLLDEPLSNLDPYWTLRLIEIVHEEVTASRCCSVISLHDLSLIDRFDRLLVMEQGSIIADVPPARVAADGLLERCFGIEWSGGGWRISSQADPRSSR